MGAVEEPELICKEGGGLGYIRVPPEAGHGEALHVQSYLSPLIKKSSENLIMCPLSNSDADQLMVLHELVEHEPHGPFRAKVNQAQFFQIHETPKTLI